MKLNLLDINDYIRENDVKEVTSIKHYKGGSRNEFNPNGLFSEEIFGRVGSKERRRTFGFINLRTLLIHPEVYPIITSIDQNLTKLILEKQNFRIEDGKLIEDEENGNSGVYFFVQNFEEIDFDELKTEKVDELEFIKKNKEKILIDKYLVLPAGIRDIKVDEKTSKTLIQYPEIIDLYVRLIRQANNVMSGIDDVELMTPTIRLIQKTLNEINNWIKNRMKGKHGLLRGGMLKKVTDYSGRLVITPDTGLKMGYVGLPWHQIIKIYEPFTIHYILNQDTGGQGLALVQEFLNLKDDPDVNDIRRAIGNINDDPQSVPTKFENYFRQVAEEIASEKVVGYKRDPVESVDSWQSAYIRVDDTGHTMSVNPYDLNRNGGDFDGDQCSIFALLTNEAQKEAKEKLNPIHTKSVWTGTQSAESTIFKLTHDAAMAVYSATKEQPKKETV